MDNLNAQLQPINSPIAQNQGAVSAYDFNAGNERNAVDLAHIKNFNFSAGTGGILTLGGTANGNGILLIKNAGGTTVGSLDNTGLTITGGSIAVYNSSGSLTFDSSGVVSTPNFALSSTFYGTTQQISGTSYVDLANSSSTLVLTRSTRFLFTFLTSSYLIESVGNTGNAVIFLDIDGVTTNSGAIFMYSGNNANHSYSFSYITTLNAGTRVIKAKARIESVTAGTPILNMGEYTLSRVALGN